MAKGGGSVGGPTARVMGRKKARVRQETVRSSGATSQAARKRNPSSRLAGAAGQAVMPWRAAVRALFSFRCDSNNTRLPSVGWKFFRATSHAMKPAIR